MITEDRDLAFWSQVITPQTDLGFLQSPFVLPLRSEHGGYLLARLDALGRVWDLHAAYTPLGWGREAHAALKAVLRRLDDWQLINVSEVEGNRRSRPPLSFGFRPAGPMQAGFRTWFLTRAAWEASPASRRTE